MGCNLSNDIEITEEEPKGMEPQELMAGLALLGMEALSNSLMAGRLPPGMAAAMFPKEIFDFMAENGLDTGFVLEDLRLSLGEPSNIPPLYSQYKEAAANNPTDPVVTFDLSTIKPGQA